MKYINTYIFEKLKISKPKNNQTTKYKSTLFPETKDELVEIIKGEIEKRGNSCSLNHIDISLIDDLSCLFATDNSLENIKGYGLKEFNGDISEWDVSNVRNMEATFYGSKFNGDISSWEVYNVENMRSMFFYSKFNGDISQWDVSNVEDMQSTFRGCKFDGNISKWNVSNVKNMKLMFMDNRNFDQDLSKWDVSNVENMNYMFAYSNFNQNISNWDVSNVKTMEYMFLDSAFNQDISNWKINDKCVAFKVFAGCPIEDYYKPKNTY